MRGHKIIPVTYNGNSDQDNTIVSGEKFNCKKKFMIISSKPIPKYSKSYMEFTVTSITSDTSIRHLPFYVGIHKEPSSGFMVSDLCLGSIYYCNPYIYLNEKDYTHPLDFQYIERYNRNADTTITRYDGKLKGSVPELKTVVGVGVDMNSNTITIYSNGSELYSFQPKEFKLIEQEENIFFCIVNLLDIEVSGSINYGRIQMKYKPKEYWSLYQYYYDKIPDNNDISCKVFFGTRYSNPAIMTEMNTKIKLLNNLAPIDMDKTHERDPYLIYTRDDLQFSTNKSFVMNSPWIDPNKNEMATICYPIPIDQKIYLEVKTKNCELVTDPNNGYFNKVGIPLIIGISDRINDISRKSFYVELDHTKRDKYKTHSISNGVEKTYDIESVLTPTVPVQPDNVGVILDLAHNIIQLITNGDLFCTINIRGVDFSKEWNLGYFFIMANTSSFVSNSFLEEKEHAIVNCGSQDTAFDFPEQADNKDVMSLWYYYNYTIRVNLSTTFDCTIETLPDQLEFNRYLSCNLFVPDTVDPESLKWSPGLNKLWKTYNTISDTEKRSNVPDISSFEMYSLIEADSKYNKR